MGFRIGVNGETIPTSLADDLAALAATGYATYGHRWPEYRVETYADPEAVSRALRHGYDVAGVECSCAWSEDHYGLVCPEHGGPGVRVAPVADDPDADLDIDPDTLPRW